MENLTVNTIAGQQGCAHQIGRTVSLVSLLNRITLALSTTSGKADAARVIAALLTSPFGLGYSRAFCLEYDEARDGFVAAAAAGIHDESEAELLDPMRDSEEKRLGEAAASLAEQPDLDEILAHLKAGSFWAQGIQRLKENPLLADGWLDLTVHPMAESNGCPNLVARVQANPSPARFLCDGDRGMLPAPLKAIVQTPFAAFGIRTVKGVRMVVVVDRAYQRDTAISKTDLSLLDWFGSQAAVAWANAETYAELEVSLGRLREFEALKNGFLATISHELRTPLTAVLGFLDLIVAQQVGPLNEQQRRLLERTHRQADHLLGLVNDLIELAQYQVEGAPSIPLGPVVVHHVLRSALDRLAAGPKFSRARVSIPERGEDPCIVEANDAALERILYHLIDNAVKFSSPGDQIDVRFARVRDQWHISVADSGIGIERSQLRNIFSHFYQVDARLSRAYPGMGIGLTLVKILLQATGGHILLESELGQGSIFTVVYPKWEDKPATRRG